VVVQSDTHECPLWDRLEMWRGELPMNVRIQSELFAQNAGRKKCQETRLYVKKRNEA
jgi:hypothetical protein